MNPALNGEVVEGKCETEGVDPTVLEPAMANEGSAESYVLFDPAATYSPLMTEEQREKVQCWVKSVRASCETVTTSMLLMSWK